ncbi:MAG: SH3 domain-containing protein [Victivallaceae bacterium]|nr:SH3 domain-containing protein [Victivallaceae bacterium]
MIKGFLTAMSLFILLGGDVCRAADPQSIRDFEQFPTSVPGLRPEMLYPEFWIARTGDPDRLLLTWEQVVEYNRATVAKAPTLVDLRSYPDTVAGAEVKSKLEELCKVPSGERYFLDGTKVAPADYKACIDNIGYGAIPEEIEVRWGLAARRDILRSFPTPTPVFNSSRDPEVDVFAETVLYPGEPVAVLHSSADGKWLLVQKYNYLAWAAADQIALGSRKEVLDYAGNDKFLVVTGAKVRTVHDPVTPAISEMEFDMGSRIPLAVKPVYEVDRMGTDYCFTVLVPLRRADGTLEIRPALIPRSADVNLGYLPYTRANVIRQAFKFLGERYGWGDANNARDCSGFVLNVFSCFGLIVPRNGGEQERDSEGVLFDLLGKSSAERVAVLKSLEAGDTISSPTHIMIFLGSCDGELWMIHDHIGSSYIVDGKWIDVTTRGVGVSPILGYMTSPERHYYEAFSGVKRFVLPEGK